MFGWAKKKKHKNAAPQAVVELDDIFGVPIDPNSEGPPILGKMTRFFLAKGAGLEGLFFTPAPEADVSALRKKIRQDKESIQLSSVKNVHVVAELFKQLLVALPEPPFPFEVYDFVMWTIGLNDQNHRILHLRAVINALPSGHRASVKNVIALLNRVCSQNQQVSPSAPTAVVHNIATMFVSLLLRPDEETYYTQADVPQRTEVLHLLIEQYELIMGTRANDPLTWRDLEREADMPRRPASAKLQQLPTGAMVVVPDTRVPSVIPVSFSIAPPSAPLRTSSTFPYPTASVSPSLSSSASNIPVMSSSSGAAAPESPVKRIESARSRSGSGKAKEELSEELSRRIDSQIDHNTASVLACRRRLADIKALPEALSLSRTIRDSRKHLESCLSTLNATPQEIAMYNLSSGPLSSPKLSAADDSLDAKLRELQTAMAAGVEEVLGYQTFLKAQLKQSTNSRERLVQIGQLTRGLATILGAAESNGTSSPSSLANTPAPVSSGTGASVVLDPLLGTVPSDGSLTSADASKIQALHDAAAVVGNGTVAKARELQALVESGTLEYAVSAARQLRNARKSLQQALSQVGAPVPAEPPGEETTGEADKLEALGKMTRQSCAHTTLLVAAMLQFMRSTDQLAAATVCRDCLGQVHASLTPQPVEPPPMLTFE